MKACGKLGLLPQLCDNQASFPSWVPLPLLDPPSSAGSPFPSWVPIPSIAVRAHWMGIHSLLTCSSSKLRPFRVTVTRRCRVGSPHLHPLPSVMQSPDISVSADRLQEPAPCQPGRCPSQKTKWKAFASATRGLLVPQVRYQRPQQGT